MEQNLLFDILRILTPEEIADLATISEALEKKPLTEMIESYFSGEEAPSEEEGKAKILPFASKEEPTAEESDQEKSEDEVEEEQIEASEDQHEEEEEEQESRLSDLFKVEEVVVEEKIDVINFILEEKEKFKKSRKELKGREVLKLYESNASVSVEQERNNKQNLSKSSHSGVLINKRQA